MPSAGLTTDSVLNRKTEKLKELYSLGHKLGHGQFDTTYLYIEKATCKEFTCKSITKSKLITSEDVSREIQIMHHRAGHPNVIEIINGIHEGEVDDGNSVRRKGCGRRRDRGVRSGPGSRRGVAEGEGDDAVLATEYVVKAAMIMTEM